MAQSSRGEQLARLEVPVERAVRGCGFELESLDLTRTGGSQLLKVTVDSDDGVGLDSVATLSRAVSAELDEAPELVEGSYTLEVTSPGATRPLTAPRHWKRAQGRLVRVRRHAGPELTARVGRAGEESVDVLPAGGKEGVFSLRYDDVAEAAVEMEFRPAPQAALAALGLAQTSREEAGE